jgi:CRISPR-associated protein Cas2
MTQQFVVVAYDIPDDRRRERLHNVLLDYGTPVQYSVFECLLEEKDLARMKRAVARVIRPRLDHVRYYYLCAACQGRVETTAGREVVRKEDTWVV